MNEAKSMVGGSNAKWLVAGLTLAGAAVWAWNSRIGADLRRYLKIRSM